MKCKRRKGTVDMVLYNHSLVILVMFSVMSIIKVLDFILCFKTNVQHLPAHTDPVCALTTIHSGDLPYFPASHWSFLHGSSPSRVWPTYMGVLWVKPWFPEAWLSGCVGFGPSLGVGVYGRFQPWERVREQERALHSFMNWWSVCSLSPCVSMFGLDSALFWEYFKRDSMSMDNGKLR